MTFFPNYHINTHIQTCTSVHAHTQTHAPTCERAHMLRTLFFKASYFTCSTSQNTLETVPQSSITSVHFLMPITRLLHYSIWPAGSCLFKASKRYFSFLVILNLHPFCSTQPHPLNLPVEPQRAEDRGRTQEFTFDLTSQMFTRVPPASFGAAISCVRKQNSSRKLCEKMGLQEG